MSTNSVEKFSKFHEKDKSRKLMLILSFINCISLADKEVIYEGFLRTASKTI